MNLELHCNLVHSILSRMITEDRKYKLGLVESYANLPPEKSFGLPLPPNFLDSQRKITIVPGGHIFSPFEFPSCLSIGRFLPAALSCTLDELVKFHKPASCSAESALNAALLEKFIATWVDLESQVNNVSPCSIGDANTSERFLETITDGSIIEHPIKVSTAIESFALSLENAGMQGGTVIREGSAIGEISTVVNGLIRVVLFTHALELVRLRCDLLLSHFFVMHLFNLYKSQAEVCNCMRGILCMFLFNLIIYMIYIVLECWNGCTQIPSGSAAV
jgi:hypothetical protein